MCTCTVILPLTSFSATTSSNSLVSVSCLCSSLRSPRDRSAVSLRAGSDVVWAEVSFCVGRNMLHVTVLLRYRNVYYYVQVNRFAFMYGFIILNFAFNKNISTFCFRQCLFRKFFFTKIKQFTAKWVEKNIYHYHNNFIHVIQSPLIHIFV